MAITEQDRHHMLIALEAALGEEAAMTLAEHLPPVGWADVATRRDLDALEARMDLRFASVDSRFDAVDRRFDAMDERFKSVDRRFDAMDERFKSIDSRFDAVELQIRAEVAVLGERITRRLTVGLISSVGAIAGVVSAAGVLLAALG